MRNRDMCALVGSLDIRRTGPERGNVGIPSCGWVVSPSSLSSQAGSSGGWHGRRGTASLRRTFSGKCCQVDTRVLSGVERGHLSFRLGLV